MGLIDSLEAELYPKMRPKIVIVVENSVDKYLGHYVTAETFKEYEK
jgi:hypothetical protein